MHYPVPHEQAASELLYYVESGSIEDLAPITHAEEDRLVARAHVHAILALVDQLHVAPFPLRGQVVRALAAGRVVDDEDVTDWQRGYRACWERVRGALDPTGELLAEAGRGE